MAGISQAYAEIRIPKTTYNKLYPHQTTATNRYVRKEKSWKGWSDPFSTVGWQSWQPGVGGYSSRPLTPAAVAKNRQKYGAIVSAAAKSHNLPKPLLEAVITAESAYNPKAVSSAGAMGLMQLMPATARRFGVSDPFNPTENIHGGSRYLRYLMTMFNDDLNLVLAAYNAGEGAVIRHGRRIPPYEETRRYIQRVKAFYGDSCRGVC